MSQEKNWQGKVIPFAAFAAFCYCAWGFSVVTSEGVAGFAHPVEVVCGALVDLGVVALGQQPVGERAPAGVA